VKKQLFWILFKYGLGFGILAIVVWSYWDYPGPKPNPTVTAATTIGLAASPHGTGSLAAPAAQITGEHQQRLGLVNVIGKPIHYVPLILAFIICTSSMLLTFFRWYLLVRAQDLPFTLSGALRLGLIGYFFNFVLPGSVGGDIIKATFIAREQSRRTVAVATVLLDRAIGLVGLVWLVAILGGFFWVGGYLEEIVINATAVTLLKSIVTVAIVLSAGSLGFWILLGLLPDRRADRFAGRLTGIPKVGHSLAEFWRAVWIYRKRGRVVGAALLLALIGHVGNVVMFYLASLTLSRPDEVPTLGAHYLLVPVGMAVASIPLLPGGLGVAEVAYGNLYVGVGSTFDRGVLMSLVWRVITWSLGFVGYLVYLRMKPSLPPVIPDTRREVDLGTVPAPGVNGDTGGDQVAITQRNCNSP
jgi:uncharacterized protein (TIRG00374 family)